MVSIIVYSQKQIFILDKSLIHSLRLSSLLQIIIYHYFEVIYFYASEITLIYSLSYYPSLVINKAFTFQIIHQIKRQLLIARPWYLHFLIICESHCLGFERNSLIWGSVNCNLCYFISKYFLFITYIIICLIKSRPRKIIDFPNFTI